MKHKLITWAGWYGVLAILAAYALVSFGATTAQSWLYQLLNLTGALGIVAEALNKKDYQPAALNIVWTIVAIVALAQLLV